MKSALETGRAIAAGKLDPVENVEETLDRIDASGLRDDVFVMLTRERALREAEASRKRQKEGDLLSALDGVPVSWKDLFDTAGLETRSGSKLLAGRVPDKDCSVLKNMTEAGAVCIGKTHLSELAFSGLGINPNSGTPPNIYGKEFAPGGSSSGAAASIANGFSPIGIGSDTGGSVRIPAAWNDLVGLKTTHGFLPSEGIVPLCESFDTPGALAGTVEDVWTATALMAGEAPDMPQAKPLDKCRFMVCETILLDDLADSSREGFEHSIEALQKQGAHVDLLPIPLLEEMLPLGPILFPYEAWQAWGEKIEQEPDLMFEPVRNRFLSGKPVTKAQFDEAWVNMLALRETFEALIGDYDGLLAPTVAIAPPKVQPLLEDYDLFGETNMMALRNTRFFNMFGSCAYTLPTQSQASGLMMVGSAFQERQLTSVARAVQAVLRS